MKEKDFFIGWLEREIKYDEELILKANNKEIETFFRGHFEGLRLARGYAKTFLEDMKNDNTYKRADWKNYE